MAKVRTQYICQNCGGTSPRWMGRCPTCGEWNTLVETRVESPASAGMGKAAVPFGTPQPLAEVKEDAFTRLTLPLAEFNRVLGGGIVPGSLVLVGGEPGIGKSTLLLQVASLVSEREGLVLYVSGEESAQQMRLRARRLGIQGERLYVLTETNLEAIITHLEELSPRMLIVDSIQTVYCEGLTSGAGSVSQVREAASRLMKVAKGQGLPIFIVGHVTKAGAIAGPKVLEHIVDTVLYLEGERFHTYRLLRSVKNRFGPASEVGVFEMRSEGMVEVPNPSETFLAERLLHASGSAIAVTMEGTRPLLVEIQALASTTSFGQPRRTTNGVDFNRLLLITAVLSRRVGIRLYDQDVFVNVVGGLRIEEPAVDLAVAVAIVSSTQDRPVTADLALVGEVGLSGELRSVGQLEARLNEATKLGFKRCIVPRSIRHQPPARDGLEVIGARSVQEAAQIALRQRG
jgi:DNA repair protein RadA/Sms